MWPLPFSYFPLSSFKCNLKSHQGIVIEICREDKGTQNVLLWIESQFLYNHPFYCVYHSKRYALWPKEFDGHDAIQGDLCNWLRGWGHSISICQKWLSLVLGRFFLSLLWPLGILLLVLVSNKKFMDAITPLSFLSPQPFLSWAGEMLCCSFGVYLCQFQSSSQNKWNAIEWFMAVQWEQCVNCCCSCWKQWVFNYFVCAET